MIVINKPYITNDIHVSRLCADIECAEFMKTMYFEVPREYEKYLCDEVGDAFLTGLLNYAFSKGEDVICLAPVSEKLLYQLNTYYLPVLPKVRKKHYKKITITADPYMGKFSNEGAVGTSASGGVDSFYSIVKHEHGPYPHYQLTHLLIANQFNVYNSEEETREKFRQLREMAQSIAKNYNLRLIEMYTNHHEFLFDGFIQQYTFRICSYIFALQKLFAVYYVSSGTAFKDFSFLGHDSDDFDIFNLYMMSTDKLTFYSSGGEVGRIEKIKVIIQDEFIQSHLKVCNTINTGNCSKCFGCMRTMLSLDILGELKKFDTVFDLKEFQKRRKHYLAAVISKRIGKIKSLDILENAKKYHYHIPFSSYMKGYLIDVPIFKMKEFFKKFRFLRQLYFSLKLDFLVYGKEKAILYRYGTENEIKGR